MKSLLNGPLSERSSIIVDCSLRLLAWNSAAVFLRPEAADTDKGYDKVVSTRWGSLFEGSYNKDYTHL